MPFLPWVPTGGSITLPVPIVDGGTGKTTQAAAMTALAGTQTAGDYLRSDGTNTALAGLAAADLTGTVGISQGGTGQGTASAALTALGGQAAPRVLSFSITGTVAVTTGDYRLYNDSGASWTVTGVRASVGTAPTGQSLIVDVLVSGTTIFTNSAHRPAITATTNTSGNQTTIDAPTVAAGSYLTVNVAQVGSGTAGADLVVQIEC